MKYRASSYSSPYRTFTIRTLGGLGVFLLALYIYFMYLTAHVSFTIDHQQKMLVKAERAYQEQEERYFSAMNMFRIEEKLGKQGFTKIVSPHFLSRVISVALHEE